MGEVVRFSVSIEADLLEAFDALISRRGVPNRSEAIRDAIRCQLIRREWDDDDDVAGVVTLLYDHHRPGLSQKLTELQHHAGAEVISSTHVHLDHRHCLEFVAVRGRAGAISALADHLAGLKGVKHGELTATSTGERLG